MSLLDYPALRAHLHQDILVPEVSKSEKVTTTIRARGE